MDNGLGFSGGTGMGAVRSFRKMFMRKIPLMTTTFYLLRVGAIALVFFCVRTQFADWSASLFPGLNQPLKSASVSAIAIAFCFFVGYESLFSAKSDQTIQTTVVNAPSKALKQSDDEIG